MKPLSAKRRKKDNYGTAHALEEHNPGTTLCVIINIPELAILLFQKTSSQSLSLLAQSLTLRWWKKVEVYFAMYSARSVTANSQFLHFRRLQEAFYRLRLVLSSARPAHMQISSWIPVLLVTLFDWSTIGGRHGLLKNTVMAKWTWPIWSLGVDWLSLWLHWALTSLQSISKWSPVLEW